MKSMKLSRCQKRSRKLFFFLLLPFFSTETAFITKGHEQVREHHLRTNVDGTPKTSQFATFPEVIVFFVIFPSAVFRLHVYKLPGTPPSSLPTLSCELQATSVDHPDSPHTLIWPIVICLTYRFLFPPDCIGTDTQKALISGPPFWITPALISPCQIGRISEQEPHTLTPDVSVL